MSSVKLGFGKIQKRLRSFGRSKKLQPVLFIAAVAVVGSVFVLLSQAATPVTSFQAEAGTRSGNVATVTDATASAGSAVKFGSATTGGGIPVAADFPTRDSVGPATTPTVAYNDCYFDASQSGEVIENRVLNCAGDGIKFTHDASNIVIRNSILYGGILTPGVDDTGAETFPRTPIVTIEDSEIIQSKAMGVWPDRAAYGSHFTIRRSLVQGSHSGVGGHNNVTLEDNFITTDGTDGHQSGIRMLQNNVIRGNTITCKPVGAGTVDSGCSAHGVFYREAISGENRPAYNLTIENNYFKRGVTAGGALGGPYFGTRFIDCASWTDCTGIRFTGNLFSLGEGTDAGEFPFYGGNVWSNNYWTDGQPANSGQSR